MDFLNIEGFFKKLYEQVNYLAFNSFDDKFLNRFTMNIWKCSREHLDLIRGEQMLDVF